MWLLCPSLPWCLRLADPVVWQQQGAAGSSRQQAAAGSSRQQQAAAGISRQQQTQADAAVSATAAVQQPAASQQPETYSKLFVGDFRRDVPAPGHAYFGLCSSVRPSGPWCFPVREGRVFVGTAAAAVAVTLQ